MKVKSEMKSLSYVWLLETPWTAAYQAPQFMGFSRQEYRSGLPVPSPELVQPKKKTTMKKIHMKWCENDWVALLAVWKTEHHQMSLRNVEEVTNQMLRQMSEATVDNL